MTTSKKYPVRVDGRIFLPAAQSESDQAWGRALAFAHRKEITFCECVPRQPIALSVKHYGSTTGGGHYRLARWLVTGIEHAVDCVFFSQDAEGGASASSNPSFHEFGGGMIRVHLARPLAVAGATKVTAGATTGTTPDGRPVRQRASDGAFDLKSKRGKPVATSLVLRTDLGDYSRRAQQVDHQQYYMQRLGHVAMPPKRLCKADRNDQSRPGRVPCYSRKSSTNSMTTSSSAMARKHAEPSVLRCAMPLDITGHRGDVIERVTASARQVFRMGAHEKESSSVARDDQPQD